MSLDDNSSQQVQEFCLNLMKQSDHHSFTLILSCNEPSLPYGNCVTFDQSTNTVSISNCPNFQINNYTLTTARRILLPQSFSQLNDYMCGPMNTKGTVCSECADGFAPSFTSFGSKCVSCHDTWYGVPLFICLELVPITFFYFIILVFQISFATAPMPCFIMYAQFIVTSLYLCRFNDNASLKALLFTHDGNLKLDMKTIDMIYGVFNLDFFRLFLPPLCINNKMKFIHIFLFGYISALYPFLLITLTWISIELHGHNFRPLVWLWRPFHRCFVSLRRTWDESNDIIDVFVTFFLLSYSRCLYQTIFLLVGQRIYNYTESGQFINIHHQLMIDQTVAYVSKDHLLFLIPALMIFVILNILPPLLLILHPCKTFKMYLSKCRLNFLAMNIFIDKLQGCYRDGMGEGRDMRSFSGLYFFLRMAIVLIAHIFLKLPIIPRSLTCVWISVGTAFFIVGLFIVLIKPYKKAHMNYLDALLLSNLALMVSLFAARFSHMLYYFIRVLLLSPIAGLLLLTIYNKFDIKSASLKLKKVLKLKQLSSDTATTKSISDIEEKQPLLAPCSGR